jgi:hypothetical protein
MKAELLLFYSIASGIIGISAASDEKFPGALSKFCMLMIFTLFWPAIVVAKFVVGYLDI